MKRLVKQYLWVLVPFVAIGAVVGIVCTRMIHNRPEIEKTRMFLLNHEELFAHLGTLEEVSFNKNAEARVSLKSERTEGCFVFDVVGELGREEVVVYWESRSGGDEFAVLIVKVLQNGRTPTVVWRK